MNCAHVGEHDNRSSRSGKCVSLTPLRKYRLVISKQKYFMRHRVYIQYVFNFLVIYVSRDHRMKHIKESLMHYSALVAACSLRVALKTH